MTFSADLEQRGESVVLFYVQRCTQSDLFVSASGFRPFLHRNIFAALCLPLICYTQANFTALRTNGTRQGKEITRRIDVQCISRRHSVENIMLCGDECIRPLLNGCITSYKSFFIAARVFIVHRQHTGALVDLSLNLTVYARVSFASSIQHIDLLIQYTLYKKLLHLRHVYV